MRNAKSQHSNVQSTGWLAYLDVYGFSSLVEKDDNAEIADKLLQVHTASASALRKVDLHQFFSDSIFIFAIDDRQSDQSSDRAFERVSAAVREIVNHAIAHDLFMRGSFAYGTITARTNIILGKPILRAYNREQSLPFPIVIVPELELEKGHIPDFLPLSTIDTKTGIVSAAVIFPHSRTGALERAESNARKFATNGPDHVAQAWARYAKLLRQATQSEEKFRHA